MANAEHLLILSHGVAHWNQWRQEHPDEIPDLAGADLTGRNLEDINLTGANLANVVGRKATLSRAVLTKASLRSSDFSDAALDGADLSEADGGQATFDRASMTGSILRGNFVTASFKRANLTEAQFNGAQLVRAGFTDATLCKANFQGAYLYEATLAGGNLEGADLMEADASGANLTGVSGLALNRTLTRNAVFSLNAKDAWSVLRRNYTGPKLLFHLLLLVTFFVPLGARAVMWGAVNHVQQRVLETSADLRALSQAAALSAGMASERTAAALESLANVEPCLAKRCVELPLWKVLLGFDRGATGWVLALSLLVYNIVRAALTWVVGPLRDEEERSGYSPVRSGIEGYGWLIWPHRLVRVLFVLAIGSFVFHGYHWLSLPIFLPRS